VLSDDDSKVITEFGILNTVAAEAQGPNGDDPDVVADVGGDNPENFEFLRVTVGTARESPTVLTRNDWHPTESRSFNDPLANGYWALQVAATGRFDVRTRFPASFGGGRVTLRLYGDERAGEWQSGVGTYLFDQVLLESGRVDLQVTVDDGESVGGAWQVEIMRRSGENRR
jgi:hypothetical protein